MSQTHKTPSGKTVVIKESISRKEDRKIKEAVFKGVSFGTQGQAEADNFGGNIEQQKDVTVFVFVESYDEKPLTMELIENLDKQDFDFIYQKADTIYSGFKQKKS